MEYLSKGWGYTTSVEHLSRRGGVLQQWNIFPQGGGVHHLSGIFVHRGGGGGGGTTSVEYLSRGGGRTPPQWKIFPQGGGYTTSVEYLSTGGGGGGGGTTSMEYLSKGWGYTT